MPNQQVLNILMLATLVLAGGCSTLGGAGGSVMVDLRQQMARLVETGAGGNDATLFLAMQDELRHDTAAMYRDIRACLADGARGGVDGGAVTFNGTPLQKENVQSGGGASTIYTSGNTMRQPRDTAYAFPLQGDTLQFRVAGSTSIPAMAAAVPAPVGSTVIREPEDRGVAQKQERLRLRWEPGSGADTVMITLEQNATGYDKSITYVHLFATDNGSYTIPAAALRPFIIGSITITLRRLNYRTGPAATAPWLAVAGSAASIGLLLVE